MHLTPYLFWENQTGVPREGYKVLESVDVVLDGKLSKSPTCMRGKLRYYAASSIHHLQSGAMTMFMLRKLKLPTAAPWIKGTSAPSCRLN